MKPSLPCPVCSGAGLDTHEDRHAQTRQDVCRTCAGEGKIEAGTGQSAEAAADPATGLPFGEARPRERTPGPWFSERGISGAVQVRSVEGRKPIAEIWANGDDPEANGALVAAAPAMLLALAAFDADLSRTWGAPDSLAAQDAMIPSRRAAWQAARDALTAAQPAILGE